MKMLGAPDDFVHEWTLCPSHAYLRSSDKVIFILKEIMWKSSGQFSTYRALPDNILGLHLLTLHKTPIAWQNNWKFWMTDLLQVNDVNCICVVEEQTVTKRRCGSVNESVQ